MVDCRYTPALEAVNNKLKAYIQLSNRVDFVDCGHLFLEDDDRVILSASNHSDVDMYKASQS